MIWLVLSALFFSLNNLLWKNFIRNEHPLHLISRRAFFTTLFSIIVLFFVEKDVLKYTLHADFATLLIGCILGALGLIFMVTFLKTGSLSLMGYYALLGMTITGTYTYLLTNEPVSIKLVVGASVLIGGYLLYLWDEQKNIKTVNMLYKYEFLSVRVNTTNVIAFYAYA